MPVIVSRLVVGRPKSSRHPQYPPFPPSTTETPLMPPRVTLRQMTGQEKVGNALLDGVLVPAVAANELALCDLRLEQQVVQVLEHDLVGLQLLQRGRLLGEPGEAQLQRNSESKGLKRFAAEGNRGQGCIKAGTRTSEAVVRRAAQSRRGSTLASMSRLTSTSSVTSSASLGCSGYDAADDLHSLTAQVRKLRLRIFMAFFFPHAKHTQSQARCDVMAFMVGCWALLSGSTYPLGPN